jgi:hypothetical protein
MLWTAPPTWRVSRSSSGARRRGCDAPGSSSSLHLAQPRRGAQLVFATSWCFCGASVHARAWRVARRKLPLLIGGRTAVWQHWLSILPYSSSFLPTLDPKFSQTSKPNLPNSFKQTLFYLLIWNFPNKATQRMDCPQIIPCGRP